MDFQQKLQYFRKQKGLSQEVLGERIGVSRQAVAKWETGAALPDVINLLTLSSLLGVTLDRLLKDDEDECHIAVLNNGACSPDRLKEFLCEAKKNTYAAGGPKSAPSRPDSHDFLYEKEDYTYIDTYLGGECFAGEEAVWENGVPVWAMNYTGRVLEERFSGKFLDEALLNVPEAFPCRGPALYKNGDYTYTCRTQGDFSWYEGYEEIFCCGDKVYECYFHGGAVR
jgi:transcriptional regulator with XRE-family HTH domain